ncbi:PREDICTED: VQ motif-containing protein 8, chloroplastic [Tarenaya hassleriana]|uniref:VQ motif-containing protein 8, chloroplastic n=1 Tax=Tarenaya hassleriana TaxID=28532 RepID=UPI00053C4ADE|nr:PREDICTED: VQ motif-containing protein 8, chloroplastic [Tarenaya hassleriana]
MIPKRCHEINGSRPPSLGVGKLSRAIGKTASSQAVKPVIIYAHSPKVIHTRAEDFMALVQRLTGRVSRIQQPDIRRNPNDVSESSSVVTEEVNGGGEENNTTSFSPEDKASQHMAGFPLFTPSSMALLGSPNPVFRQFEPGLVMSPNRPDLISPSVFKFIKEFPFN